MHQHNAIRHSSRELWLILVFAQHLRPCYTCLPIRQNGYQGDSNLRQPRPWSLRHNWCSKAPTAAQATINRAAMPSIPWFGANSRNNGRHHTLASVPRQEETTADQNRGAGLFAQSASWSRRQRPEAQALFSHWARTDLFLGPLHAFANTTNLITAPPPRIV